MILADVFSENFKGGTMDKLGVGYEALCKLNPGLIYVSHKGFLPGPYDHRTALDEVVQMMGGMFGAIGVLAALQARHTTGRGQEVQSALFENNVLLVA